MRASRCGSIAMLTLWLPLAASGALAQTDPAQIERELQDEAAPDGARVPDAAESKTDATEATESESLDQPPPEAPPLPAEPAEISEGEIAISEEVPDAGVTLGFVVGWGFVLTEPPNPWAFGIGIQGGYTAENRLHLGGRFIYFLGEGGPNIFDFGLEAGYSLEVGVLHIIPVLGTGFAFVSAGSVSSPEAYLAPGVEARLVFDGFYVGVEARFQAVFSNPVRMGILPMAAIGLSY